MRVCSRGTFAVGWGDCLGIYSCALYIQICVYTFMPVCAYVCAMSWNLSRLLCARVACLCLNQPVNTHVESQLFLPWECVTIYVELKALAVG